MAHEVGDLGHAREFSGPRVFPRTAYDAVESGPLVPLRPAQVVLGLARAELAEVLGGLWHYILEELEGDSAKRFTWRCRKKRLEKTEQLAKVGHGRGRSRRPPGPTFRAEEKGLSAVMLRPASIGLVVGSQRHG